MPVQDLLLKLFGGDVGDIFDKIMGAIKLSPELKAQLDAQKEAHQVELAKLQIDMEEKANDAITQEIEAAGANIRAEATNGDKYTSRARPTFLYVCNALLICNYLLIPLFGVHGAKPVDFPEPLFWLFGSVMLGYVGARSWEKISGAADSKAAD